MACALLPMRLAADGCPGLSKPQGLQRAPLPVPTPRGKPLRAIPVSPGCLSGFLPEKRQRALGRARASQPQRAGLRTWILHIPVL